MANIVWIESETLKEVSRFEEIAAADVTQKNTTLACLRMSLLDHPESTPLHPWFLSTHVQHTHTSVNASTVPHALRVAHAYVVCHLGGRPNDGELTLCQCQVTP